jgi:hypothetical protein
VNLHPAVAIESYANAVSGANQFGSAYFGPDIGWRASLWSGTASSWVDITPVGRYSAEIFGASEANQVGYVNHNASLWSGTAASWVNLHPSGALFSFAFGTSGTNQVGQASFGFQDFGRASLWSGTAASWVNLHPSGATFSRAFGVLGPYQVGYAVIAGSGSRASLWSGTAASWIDITPPGYTNSEARSISTDGAFYYITGSGYNPVTEQTEALLWTQPVPEPGTIAALTLGLTALAARRKRK